MTNTETHRQFYLASAGIRMWYAKRPLPGAAPSPEYEFVDNDLASEPASHDVAEAAVEPSVKARPTQERARSRSVDLQSLMAPPPRAEAEAPVAPAVPEEIPEAVTLAGEPSVESSGPHTVISAHLAIWSTEKYLLVSQWSDEASERLQETLAGNLLKALHQSKVGERQMLHWPVFRNPQIPGNSADDFRQVLSSMVSRQQAESIILLGVLGEEQDEQRQHCLKPFMAQVGVDFPHSLAELSASPGQKRDLWNALKSRYLV
jgi:hypothetical protein